MLVKKSTTPWEMTYRRGRRACLSGGRGNFAVLRAWDFARVSSTTSLDVEENSRLVGGMFK